MTVLSPSAPPPSAIDATRTLAHEDWCTERRIADDGEWLRIGLSTGNAFPGEAWARFSDGLETAIGLATQRHAMPTAISGHVVESVSLSRIARGLVEAARIDARCRHHGMPLHLWLGGAIRTEVPITLPVGFSGGETAVRRNEVQRKCSRIRAAADSFGVRSFSVHDASTSPGLIADTIVAVRSAIGPDARLTLRLLGQLAVPDASRLVAMIRGCDLLAIVDPCDTLPASVRATEGSLPALGLSAYEYDRLTLLECLANAPPAVLFVDPLRDGGPLMARRLAAIANVLHVDIALTAAAAGPWLTAQCLSLAAALPAVAQPVELPLSWTQEGLGAADVNDGAMTLDAIPRLLTLQGTLAQV